MPPIASGVAVLWLSQMLGLALYSFGSDPSGHPLQVSPLNALMISVPLYTSWVLGLAAVLITAWVALRPLRAAVSACSLALCAVLILLTQIDFGMQRFRGERLSLRHFNLYASGNVINGDWLRPVVERPAPLVSAVVILVASWALLALVAVRSMKSVPTATLRWRDGIRCAAAAAACYAPLGFAYYHQRDMAQPPEFLLAREAIMVPAAMPDDVQRAIRDQLRRSIDPDGRWLSDEYPLMREIAPQSDEPPHGTDAPDIVFFVVESLRGSDLGYGLSPRSPERSVTPNLDALARRAVVFPRYIASGEPSPRGFITINTGAWEHKWGFIIADFPNFETDAIPLRLRAQGYHTMALWGGNPSFDNQLTWARRWYDEQLFDQPVNKLFYFRTMPDHQLMDRFIERVRAHDAAAPGQPFFAYVASNGTHTPYDLEDGAAVPADPIASSDRQRRYDLCLANIDAQIGRVVRFLESRPRGKNTIIVVIGDHADRTNDETDERWRGMPVDALVYTAALVFGPERLVGAPRREVFAASHVDLLPTVMAVTNDRAPTATLGQSLLASVPAARRFAVSVNSRGYRIDRDGYTLLVAPDDPGRFFAFRSFTGTAPTVLPLAETPFAPDEPQRLVRQLDYWTVLIERNRVWNPAMARR